MPLNFHSGDFLSWTKILNFKSCNQASRKLFYLNLVLGNQKHVICIHIRPKKGFIFEESHLHAIIILTLMSRGLGLVINDYKTLVTLTQSLL